MKHHNIPNRLRRLQERIKEHGFTQADGRELDNIDNKVTAIRVQGEQNLVPPPSPYKHTSIGKRQVTIIRLLQTLQRRYLRS